MRMSAGEVPSTDLALRAFALAPAGPGQEMQGNGAAECNAVNAGARIMTSEPSGTP